MVASYKFQRERSLMDICHFRAVVRSELLEGPVLMDPENFGGPDGGPVLISRNIEGAAAPPAQWGIEQILGPFVAYFVHF